MIFECWNCHKKHITFGQGIVQECLACYSYIEQERKRLTEEENEKD